MTDRVYSSALPAVSILGCGWFGLPFARELAASGYCVSGSTTSEAKVPELEDAGIKPFVLRFPCDILPEAGEEFFEAKVLIIAIPPGRKEGLSSGYVEKIEDICRYASVGGVKHVILISSTSVFPNGNRIFTEADLPEPDDEGSRALFDAEQAVMAESSFSTTIIRFGGLIGERRDPGRFFAGKKDVSNGLAPVNLIHLSDCIGVCKKILERKAFGRVFHACAPQHPTRMDFYSRAAARSNLPIPEFKRELLRWKVIESIEVPKVLSYSFKEKLTD